MLSSCIHQGAKVHSPQPPFRLQLQKIVGHDIPDAKLQKVENLVKRLSGLQNNGHGIGYVPERQDGSADDLEFGADLVFRPPGRFLVDVPLDDSQFVLEEVSVSPHHGGLYEHIDPSNYDSLVNGGNFDLAWLRNACDKIVNGSISQLPQDELAMAICRVLDSEKPGDEVSGKCLRMAYFFASYSCAA